MYRIARSEALDAVASYAGPRDVVILDTNAITPIVIKDPSWASLGNNALHGASFLASITYFLRKGEFPPEFKSGIYEHIRAVRSLFDCRHVLGPASLIEEVRTNYRNVVEFRRRLKIREKMLQRNAREQGRREGKEPAILYSHSDILPRVTPLIRAFISYLDYVASSVKPYHSFGRDVESAVEEIAVQIEKEAAPAKGREKKIPSRVDKQIVALAISHSMRNGSKAVILSRDIDLERICEKARSDLRLSPNNAILLHEVVSQNGPAGYRVIRMDR